nr:unnamed protein product [Callosobruchus chinensis]
MEVRKAMKLQKEKLCLI